MTKKALQIPKHWEKLKPPENSRDVTHESAMIIGLVGAHHAKSEPVAPRKCPICDAVGTHAANCTLDKR
jgi:hypothetical protein